MELERWRYFFKIVETGSFSLAAEELYTTQSSVSKQVALLEKELGIKLFDRSHRTVELTAAGCAVLPQARTLMKQYQQLVDTVQRQKQTIHLAVLPILGYYGLSRRLADFAARNPDIKLIVQECENASIEQMLEKGTCDAAIWRTGSIPDRGVHQELCQDELMLMLPADHPLANCGDTVNLRELAEDNFLMLSEKTNLRKKCIALCGQVGFSPKIVYTGTSGETIAGMVREDAGVALVMGEVAKRMLCFAIRVKYVTPTVREKMVLSMPSDRCENPAIQRLQAFFTETDENSSNCTE